MEAVKISYDKMKDINDALVERLIVVETTEKLDGGIDKSVDELYEEMAPYHEKFDLLKKESYGVLRKAKRIIPAEKTRGTAVRPKATPTAESYIRFNPAINLKPGKLEKDSDMLEVLQFVDPIH